MKLSFPVLGAAASWLLLCAPAPGATLRPDLVASAPRPASTDASPGGTLAVTDRVRNAGRATAGHSTTRLYLSTDRVKSGTDRLLGRRSVRALARGRASAASRTFRVPSTAPARRYYVIACADGSRAVRESDERNNCRASSAPVSVIAATPAPSPAPEQPASTDPPATSPAPASQPTDPGSQPPAPAAPPAPTGLAATPGSAGDVALSWNAVAGATGYRVLRSVTSGGPYTQIAAPAGATHTDTGRGDSTRYYYVVRAVNDVGASPNSSEANALACVDSSTGNAAGSPDNLGTVSPGFTHSLSASICRNDQDWLQVAVTSGSQVNITLEAGTAGSPEPGEPGRLRLDYWTGGAASTNNAPEGSVQATTGAPQTATVPLASTPKTFLIRVSGFSPTTGANSYRVTVAVP